MKLQHKGLIKDLQQVSDCFLLYPVEIKRHYSAEEKCQIIDICNRIIKVFKVNKNKVIIHIKKPIEQPIFCNTEQFKSTSAIVK